MRPTKKKNMMNKAQSEELPAGETQIMGWILGHKYGIRAELYSRDQTPERTIRTLLQAVKNTMLLRLKYPDDTDEELEARMQKGDPVTQEEEETRVEEADDEDL